MTSWNLAARRPLAAGSLLLLLAACAGGPAPAQKAAAPTSDALTALNRSFRDNYRDARAAAIAA